VSLSVREKLVCDLFTATMYLGADELRVLCMIACRAEMGRKQYGDLNLAIDRRNMRAELGAELLDACFYGACEVIRAEGGVS
jgi:hypothetical protein